MTYSIKKAFAILSLAIFGSVLLYNCEPDPDSLGEQLFLDGAAHGEEVSFPVIAYNINNNDSIRSDAAKLGLATLGGVQDAQFGKQKASYYTQLRLPSYNPDFGTNAAIDSVVLVIKPTYAPDSITTNTNESYTYPDGNVPAKKVVNTYPAIKYGRTKAPKVTIKVNEVTEFLNGASDFAYSNKKYDSGEELGRKDFTGTVNSVTITKTSDASSLFTSAVGFRIPLKADFFKSKILDKKGQPELSDVSNFIRYFKGLKISVEEDDAYLMQFAPNDVELVMYYKNDKTENGTTTRPQTKYTFTMGAGNAHIGNYEYERSSQYSTYVIGNKELGDEKLYTQGMGGPSIGVRLSKQTIDDLKTLYKNNKAAIISAKIRMYTDNVWTNQYAKPKYFAVVQRDKDANGVTTAFTTDLVNLGGSNNFSLYRAYNLDKNPTYYDFTVTKSVKDIVEGTNGDTATVDNIDRYFKIDLGGFLNNATNTGLAGYQYTSRSYAMDRAVFIGSKSTDANRIQLKIIYGTK